MSTAAVRARQRACAHDGGWRAHLTGETADVVCADCGAPLEAWRYTEEGWMPALCPICGLDACTCGAEPAVDPIDLAVLGRAIALGARIAERQRHLSWFARLATSPEARGTQINLPHDVDATGARRLL